LRQADVDINIEVTEAMASAGAAIIADRYDQFGDGVDEIVATRIFMALSMCRSNCTNWQTLTTNFPS
jgi:hypothetical protein